MEQFNLFTKNWFFHVSNQRLNSISNFHFQRGQVQLLESINFSCNLSLGGIIFHFLKSEHFLHLGKLYYIINLAFRKIGQLLKQALIGWSKIPLVNFWKNPLFVFWKNPLFVFWKNPLFVFLKKSSVCFLKKSAIWFLKISAICFLKKSAICFLKNPLVVFEKIR